VNELESPQDKEVLLQFCRPLVQFQLERSGGRMVKTPFKTFAGALKNRSEFRFHVNQLTDLLQFLTNRGYKDEKLTIIKHKPDMGDYPSVNHKWVSPFEPRDKQPAIIDHVMGPGSSKMVALQTGKGKALKHGTLVRIPGGWKPIEEIVIGDSVISRDGTTTKVIGVYPQGQLQLYKVTFVDGRSVEVCEEHLWSIHYRRGKRFAYQVMSVRQIMDQAKRDGSYSNLSIDLVQPDTDRSEEIRQVLDSNVVMSDETYLVDLLRSAGYLVEQQPDGMVVTPPQAVDWKLGIRSIEPSRVDHATCIAVDHPEKLYVVQDYIVTHNTFIAMWCTKLLQLRTIFIFKGGYVERWLGDLKKTFDFDDDDEMLVVRGSAGLIRLMDDALDGSIKAKCIIVTNRTMYDYLKDHEVTNGQSELYPVPADQFYQTLGIGFRVIDEVHQEFHFNFRQDLYTHTLKSLSLSATLTSNDRFMNQMYDIAYPVKERNDGGGYHAYINAIALMYRLSKPKLYRYKGGTGGYSHNAFEQSMMSKKDFFPKYLEVFEHVVRNRFFAVMEKGQKMLVFCASVQMCTKVQEFLKKKFPTLVIGRYTQEDDYSVLEQSDVTVSTVLSAGTAVDIPNLRVTFMSTAIDSRQSNEQALGRTRELKDWPHISPEFIYLTCEDVDKHMNYHRNKMDYFRGKVLSHKELRLPITV
jgi:hypothetical protein